MSSTDFSRQQIQQAVSCAGFDGWVSPLDSTTLHRPARRPDDLPGTGRHAAVMVLLYPARSTGQSNLAECETQLVLIRRSQQLRHHAGQIAFPGGRQEPGEPLPTTAIRETSEEIGVVLPPTALVGQLRPVYLPPSDFTLTPFVGWLDKPPVLLADPNEVDEILSVSLRIFLESSSQTTASVVRDNGHTIEAPCYHAAGQTVWGATALVISELVARLKAVKGG